MARNVTIDQTEFAGAMKVRFITFDITSYSAGGESLDPTDAGMHRFQKVNADVSDGTGYVAQYNVDTGNVMLFGGTEDSTGSGGSIELQEASSGSSATVSLMVLGR